MNKYDITMHTCRVIESCETEAHLEVALKVYRNARRLLKKKSGSLVSTMASTYRLKLEQIKGV